MRSPRLLQSNKEFLNDSRSDSHGSGLSQKRLVQGTQICVGEAQWLVSELGLVPSLCLVPAGENLFS